MTATQNFRIIETKIESIMRGNLVWGKYRSEVNFVPDEDGEYEVVDGGRITQRNNFLDSNVDYRQEKLDDNFWNDDRVIEFVTTRKMKDCSLSDLNEFKKTELHFAVENFGTPHWSDEGVREFKRKREKYLLHAQVKQSQPESNPDDENYKNYFLERDRKFLLSEPNPELKDCVITAFKIGNDICGLNSYGQYADSKGVGSDLEFLLRNNCPIYSVKRLSDEIEFAIQEETNYGIIGLFFIKDGKMMIQQDKTIGKGFGGVPISSLTKKKDEQILFTTDDGVGVIEGQRTWFVDLYTWGYADDTATKIKNHESYFKAYKHFSTEEKLQEYILLNKPLLSVQDVIEHSGKYMEGSRCSEIRWVVIKDFENLAKEKMKA